jgi:D-arabinose 1-dehydrogenase-like Zn-dependent alcohol dehydrogenase
VVIGAGGLGHIGIQVLHAISPAELIVLDRNPDAAKLALSIGADHAVVADVADGREVKQVQQLTGGQARRWSSTSSARAGRRPRGWPRPAGPGTTAVSTTWWS